MNPKYELLRDLPDYKAGMVFELWGTDVYQAITPCENGEYGKWPKRYVEDNPTWFKKLPERIEVSHVQKHDRFLGNKSDTYWYQFSTNTPFDENKFYAIKQAIERVLNDEDEICMGKKYFIDQLRDAFNAAREQKNLDPGHNVLDRIADGRKYPTFESYIKSIKP